MSEQQEQVAQPLYLDNTRVSTFFKCPRMYYYRHIRGWQREGSRIALTFGGAWHVMMEIVWLNANSPMSTADLVDLAEVGFKERWAADGYDPEAINLDDKRTPGLARDMCFAYVKEYRDGGWFKTITLLCNEQPFVIPLGTLADGTPFFYIGRWDKAYLRDDRVYVGEHKTTSVYRKVGNFAAEFTQSFSPDSQVDGYQYAALGAFGDRFKGVSVDAALVHKTVRAFKKIPVQRTFSNLDAWAWEAKYWINEIYDNAQMLAEVGDEGDYLKCFPKRTEQCFHKYGSCAYLDLCKFGNPNPAKEHEVPDGFTLSIWDPFQHNVEAGQKPMGMGEGSALIEQMRAEGKIT